MKIIFRDNIGKRLTVYCKETDSIIIIKKILSIKTSIDENKIILKKNNIVLKNHLTLMDYEIKSGNCLDLFY